MSTPWFGAVPYLSSGIFPEAQNYFNNYSTLNNNQLNTATSYFDTLNQRKDTVGQMQGLVYGLGTGQFNPTQGPVSMTQANANMGALNPSAAYVKMLSGQPDNPYLGAMNQANINTSLRGYHDAMQDMAQTVMPGIGDQAFASGQYGGSRQGIAEGLMLQQASRNARDLGIAAMDSGNQLFGSAYDNAQTRMGNAANTLSGMGLQNAQFNANLDLSQKAAGAKNATDALQAMQSIFGQSDNIYNQQQSLLQAPQIQAQNALNQYANIVSPGAAMGGTQSQSIPIYQGGTLANMMGGSLGIAGLLGSLK